MKLPLFVLILIQLECASLAFILCNNQHFYMEGKSNRMTSIELGPGGIVNCKYYGKVNFLQAIYIKLPHHCVTTVEKAGMKNIMGLCPKIQSANLMSSLFLDRIPKFRFGIFPGTKWCGAGNIASSEEDFGFLQRLDSCCKAHDKCPQSIPMGETKFGIKNTYLGSISHCDCDEDFYDCLRSARCFAADKVGFTFFNILAMPCFKKDYPVVKCLIKEGLTYSQCQKYEKDTTKEQIWQLFDSRIYRTSVITDVINDFKL